MILEVCVDSVLGARTALAAGADRVELCGELTRGGTSPGPGAIRLACEEHPGRVVVLLRPRGGDFEYDRDELRELWQDLAYLNEVGAAGAALGVLDATGRIDRAALEDLVAAAGPLPLTFHRAFDWSTDPLADLEVLREVGVARLLTSGCARSASAGRELAREIIARAGEDLEVLLAGGVRAPEAAELVAATGARALHFGAFSEDPIARHERSRVAPLSASAVPSDARRSRTSADQVAAMREVFRR